jgi:hypothetical protein
METQTLVRVDEKTFEFTKVLEGWPIRSYVKVSPKGERVTIYSWETIKCDLNVHKRLCKNELKALESYLWQIERSLRQLGMTEEQVREVLNEVKRRLG